MSLSDKKTDEPAPRRDKDLDIDGQLSEKILGLKKSRAGFKVALTKKINDLRELKTEETNMDEVKLKFKELLESWEKLKIPTRSFMKSLPMMMKLMNLRSIMTRKAKRFVPGIKQKIFMWIYAI